ncbi:ribbon-helix-helix protein, CopG family [Candidatus Poriferisodalis sp.]|uniref:ribbon-helix-helix protein, CopG family n=1 Tax=Candidatus Poriferisodalis sp. TaxID=3101277 RepID=UPI003B5B2A6E
MTLRIDRTLADRVRTVAEVEGLTVSDVIRAALTEHVERRRRDPEFQALLRRNLKRHQELLNMLADS